ncbi:hypothetical protein [Gandjariella thermophila]|uniref:hypothetical protein n=1 Tax=Gandjariella thermophila TaxID=1931992 RepID=UPI0010FA13AC|nr:hypothetical protein [Gandjariella thermophila]
MLAERAVQQVHAFHGDLVARMLLSEQDGDGALASRLRTEEPLYRCRDGSVALTDGTVAADVLRDTRFTSVPAEPGTAQYTLACVDEVIRAESGVVAPESPSTQDEVNGAVSRVLRARPSAELDLVTEVIRPVVADVLGDALDVPIVRRQRFQRLTELAGRAMDASVCPPRLTDGYALRDSLRELRDLCGAEAYAVAVLGAEMAVNLATNAALGMLRDLPAADDLTTLVPRLLFQDPPVRLHRLFTREPVDLAGQRIEAGTRVLILNGAVRRERSGAQATALTVAAHPRLAPMAIGIAIVVGAALRGHLGRLRLIGGPARRLRAPVTRAIVRLPVSVTDREAR